MNRLYTLLSPLLARLAISQSEAPSVVIEKLDGTLTPNMRALRLTMSIAEQLISMGTPAQSVVHMSLSITDIYCTRKVHIDVISSQLILSQDRGNDHEPLTLIRTIPPREVNYQHMQCLQTLVARIADNKLTLDAAERELDDILAKPRRYSQWIIYMAGGGLSAGSALLYTASLPVIIASLLMGITVMWLLARLNRLALPVFFTQIVSAVFIALTAAFVTWLAAHHYLDVIGDINPTIITVSGIVLLVAGMMIVGAFQDAIDEYYVTASGRLLKVIMMTMGVVSGVMIGLYAARRLGVEFMATPEQLQMTGTMYQYIGAAIVAATFALGNHTRPGGVVLTGATGVLGYYIFLAITGWGLSAIPASAAAGLVIGFIATLASRLWHMPSLAIVNASIVPLVPGVTLYNGLMGVVTNDTDNIGLLVRAVLIAIAIAAGASFGVMVGRPTRRSFVRLRNRLPQRRLHSKRTKRTDSTPTHQPH